MTFRNNNINKKKNKTIKYTLDITQNLPKPDYTKSKSRFKSATITDALETQLKD